MVFGYRFSVVVSQIWGRHESFERQKLALAGLDQLLGFLEVGNLVFRNHTKNWHVWRPSSF
jgi:hypothetical protein